MRLRCRVVILVPLACAIWWLRETTPVRAQPSSQAPPTCANTAASRDSHNDWKPDCELGQGFFYKTLKFQDDYDGKVTATVVRNQPLLPDAKGTVLATHGFLDYVFHRHLAEHFIKEKYNFYGLDLRKYGRSMDGAVHPNYCHSMTEYFPEIKSAIDLIVEHDQNVILYAHSTGALPAVLYAKQENPARIRRIVLNSPFLDFPLWRIATLGGRLVGWPFPFMSWKDPVSSWYARSLHKEYKGEWVFNRDWKPIDGAVAYMGWVRCVDDAQSRIKTGLGLNQRVLVMHSDKSSTHGRKWKPEYADTDLILDVKDIKKLSDKLGRAVKREVIRGAVHDVVLSKKPVREHAMKVMTDWLNQP